VATPSELLLDELIAAAEDLFLYGTHEGSCTNEGQMKVAQKIAPCKKHQEALQKREKRFRSSLEQVKLLRDLLLTH
jgi:hypothetical protein